jgi:hypothetical protein
VWIVDAKDVATCLVTDDPRDERSALRRLAILLDLYSRTHGDSVIAVFDGEPFEVVPACDLTIEIRFARPGTRFAVLARALTACGRPGDTYVATSNQAFAQTVRHRGAHLVPSRIFRGWLESLRW